MSTARPVALITGGAKGIGHAIARHLVSSGWQVSIIDLQCKFFVQIDFIHMSGLILC